MIRIVQAGESGKAKYLFDMHRFRTRIFKENMKWNVNVDINGLEIDDFDVPEAVYFLAFDADDRVVGTWRLLPTTIPIMINKVWPEFLNTIEIPSSSKVWEASRFSVNSSKGASREGLAEVNKATKELFYALTKVCLLCGIDEIYTMYDMSIGRLVKRINCEPYKRSETLEVFGRDCEVGAFRTDEIMLANIIDACKGVPQNFTRDDLPPLLLDMYDSNNPSQRLRVV
jgi:N-acyl-L-homoserine lactone synthetase